MVPFLFFTILFSEDIDFTYATGTFLNKHNKEIELRVFINIPNDQITFIKQGKKFVAKYEVSCILKRKAAKEFGDIWTGKSEIEQYENTVSKSLRIHDSFNLPLSPSKYNLTILVRDLNSQRIGEKESLISITDLKQSSPISISTVIFKRNSHLKMWEGSPYPTYKKGDTISLFFEIYSCAERPITYYYTIETEKRTDTIFNQITSMGYQHELQIYPVNIKIPTDDMKGGKKRGDYLKNIILNIEDIHKELRFVLKEPFFIKDYNKRVATLIYIAEPDELKKLKEAEEEERERLWKEFWDKRDPSPGTDRNEAEEEHFERVEYANKHFSCGIEGWRTDRGRIYIKYGKPDEIESHPFEINQPPYEIWYYYSKKRRFVFVDKHGFGDYILVTPEYKP